MHDEPWCICHEIHWNITRTCSAPYAYGSKWRRIRNKEKEKTNNLRQLLLILKNDSNILSVCLRAVWSQVKNGHVFTVDCYTLLLCVDGKKKRIAFAGFCLKMLSCESWLRAFNNFVNKNPMLNTYSHKPLVWTIIRRHNTKQPKNTR